MSDLARNTDPYRPSEVPTWRPEGDGEETTLVSARSVVIPASAPVPLWCVDGEGREHLVEWEAL